MGPDGGLTTAVGLALTGIDHHDLFHIAVAIPIVIGKVHLFVHLLTGLHDHLVGVRIIVVWRHVLSVILIVVTHQYRTYHIERQLQQSVALVVEIITHTTLKPTLTEALLVGNPAEQ